jgi:hypothetical protein
LFCRDANTFSAAAQPRWGASGAEGLTGEITLRLDYEGCVVTLLDEDEVRAASWALMCFAAGACNSSVRVDDVHGSKRAAQESGRRTKAHPA